MMKAHTGNASILRWYGVGHFVEKKSTKVSVGREKTGAVRIWVRLETVDEFHTLMEDQMKEYTVLDQRDKDTLHRLSCGDGHLVGKEPTEDGQVEHKVDPEVSASTPSTSKDHILKS